MNAQADAIFWYASSLLLEELRYFYKAENDIVITEKMYYGLNLLYPDKNNDDYKEICDDIRNKYSITSCGIIRTANGLIL